MSNEIDDSDTGIDEPPKPPATAEVTVKGPGISITRPVDEATMASVIALLFGGTYVSPGRQGGTGRGTNAPFEPAGQAGRAQPSTQWDPDLTLGEFVVETDAKTFSQKICAAGYYLMNFQSAASFTRDEVRSALANAHEDMPANFARDWTQAASNHLIALKQGETTQFIIPRTGRTAVESHFSELPKRRSNRRTPKKAGGNSNESAG